MESEDFDNMYLEDLIKELSHKIDNSTNLKDYKVFQREREFFVKLKKECDVQAVSEFLDGICNGLFCEAELEQYIKNGCFREASIKEAIEFTYPNLKVLYETNRVNIVDSLDFEKNEDFPADMFTQNINQLIQKLDSVALRRQKKGNTEWAHIYKARSKMVEYIANRCQSIIVKNGNLYVCIKA